MPHPPAIAPERLATRCDPAQFDFETTASLPEPQQAFGQARAIEAARLALGVAGRGYNLFVLGRPGSGRHRALSALLESHAATLPPPADWCYVNDFADPVRPKALRLPAGLGARLQAAMERFVGELGKAITATLEGDEYRARIEAIEKDLKEREERALGELGDAAQREGVGLLRTPQGLMLVPLKEGHPIAPPDFERLPPEERERLAGVMKQLQEPLERLMRETPRWQREMYERERQATRDALGLAAGHLVEELKERFADQSAVLAFLDEVLADVTESGGQLREQREQRDEGEALTGLAGSLSVNRYRVNLLVGHDAGGHAPVLTLDNPTHPNLIGRVDHLAHMGTLLTNFMLVKPGALHRANGGFLMIDAVKLLSQPWAWDGLKRALAAGELRIESPQQAMGWIGTLPLEPQPIPLSLKVVLFGEREHYYLLQSLDPEFDDLFKVAADFEDEVARDAAGSAAFAALAGSLARRHGLRALDRGAVAALVDHASRMAGDAHKLSTHMRELEDVIREADHAAAEAGRQAVGRADVTHALAARVRRGDRVRDALHEAVQRETLLIATTGEAVGQVNGLAVHEVGGLRFGHPVRITATARVGEGRFVDIEREATLGRPIHSKGVLILASYLGARYAQGMPLSLAASLVFEQSYGPVEGDSASLAELCALLSTLADAPILQSLAVTGSVDQHGRVQAIGGVNEKIEGFFDVCRLRGLDGTQGVVIPLANAGELMLKDEVIEAAAQGRFAVHAVADVDAAIELLTGIPAGTADSRGMLPEGSINRRVVARLTHMSELRQSFGAVHPHEAPAAPRRVTLPLAAARRGDEGRG